jgi:hypothetical protein
VGGKRKEKREGIKISPAVGGGMMRFVCDEGIRGGFYSDAVSTTPVPVVLVTIEFERN